MKNKLYKRALAIFMAAALALPLAACQKSGSEPQSASTAGEGKLFDKPTEISIAISSHASWPYNEDWKIWKYFQEATGATFDIHTMPAAETATKVALMMASPDSLPDLLHLWEKKIVDQHASAGAFISLSSNPDKLPNYNKFWDTFSEEERKEIMAQRTSGDGEIYSAPVYGTHTINNLRTWMYRKDIFEKHNLQPPTNFDELYTTAKKLKELYPDSYPLCFRTGMYPIELMGPSWKNDFTFYEYYDFKENKWLYGAQDPMAKDMIEYFLRMYREGLVPPDYTTITTKAWEELMSTDRGFMTLDYIVRIDFFNVPARQQNPNYTLAIMEPPVPDTPTAQKKITKTNLDFYGYCICNTGDEERINNAFKLLDWMYTDEGSELLSWGKEGETYEVVDGQKKFILKEGSSPMLDYGVGTYGTYQRIDVAANEAIYTQEQVEQCHEAVKYTEDHANLTLWLPLNDDERKRVDELHSTLLSYCQEELSKFLIDQQPLSNWDNFQEGLVELGVEELLSIYDTAYKRVMSES